MKPCARYAARANSEQLGVGGQCARVRGATRSWYREIMCSASRASGDTCVAWAALLIAIHSGKAAAAAAAQDLPVGQPALRAARGWPAAGCTDERGECAS